MKSALKIDLKKLAAFSLNGEFQDETSTLEEHMADSGAIKLTNL